MSTHVDHFSNSVENHRYEHSDGNRGWAVVRFNEWGTEVGENWFDYSNILGLKDHLVAIKSNIREVITITCNDEPFGGGWSTYGDAVNLALVDLNMPPLHFGNNYVQDDHYRSTYAGIGYTGDSCTFCTGHWSGRYDTVATVTANACFETGHNGV
jgi:hypothetical protein